MDKKGKMGSGAKFVLILLFLVVIVGVAIFMVQQGVIGGNKVKSITSCGDSTGTLTIGYSSASPYGTAPTSATKWVSVNGAKAIVNGTTTTTYAVGDKLQVLVSATNYLDKSYTFTMPCGGYNLDASLYYSTSDNPVIRIKNDDGDFMTDNVAGGATNQTNLASGGETITLEMEIQGTNGESSGEGVYVIEFPAKSSTNVTSVTIDGKSPISVPTGLYAANNAGSKIVAFDLPAVVDGNKATHTIQIVLSGDMSGGVYTDWFAKQEFRDDDGSIKYGVVDSDGTAKYENNVDSDFYVDAA